MNLDDLYNFTNKIVNREYIYDLFGFLLQQGKEAYKNISGQVTADAFPTKGSKIIFRELQKKFSGDSELEKIDLDIFSKFLASKYPDTFKPEQVFKFLSQCYIRDFARLKPELAKERAIQVQRLYHKRILFIQTVEMLKTLISDPQDSTDHYIESVAQIAEDIKSTSDLQTGNKNNHYETASEVFRGMIQDMKSDIDMYAKIPTGISSLDEKLDGGLSKGTLNIIGARPSVGKSALGANILMGVIHDEHKKEDFKPALCFSLEMSNKQVLGRILSSITGVNANLIFKSTSDKSISNPVTSRSLLYGLKETVVNGVDENYLLMCDKSQLTLNDLKNVITTALNEYGGLSCIMLDYIQLMPVDSKQNRAVAIGEISAYLKRIAKELNIPVICLAQLNRDVEKGKGDQEPKSSDIKDSGSIEQDADLILLIQRNLKEEKAKIIISKNRNGVTDTVECTFKGESALFTNQHNPYNKLEFLVDKGGYNFD